ncbi:M56 family metallopeptidase [Brevibacillus ginsengisoli]|uniref:M56 family metallopeptidase n=1 Tax=Brevibacillus ginsengisoli TaxID=363854 RepID=UPI003CF20901
MSEFLLTLLSLSASGTIIALLLFAIKPLIRHRFSHSWQYYIFLIVIMRLLLPITPEKSLIGSWFEHTQVVWQTSIYSAEQTSTQKIMPATNQPFTTSQAAPPVKSQMQSKTYIWNYLWVFWLVGATAMLAWKFFGYRRFHKLLSMGHSVVTDPNLLVVLDNCRRGLKIGKQLPLYQNSLVSTPMLLGLRRPALVIPSREYNEDELRYIYLHELTHFKRRDLWYKWLAQLVLCLHWFNPVVYFVVKVVDRACELSCDEAVINKMSAKDKQGYGNTLIAMAASGSYKRTTVIGAMSEEKRHLKERLTAIMKSGKRSRTIMIISIVLAVLVGSGALFAGAFIKVSDHTAETGTGKVYGGYNLEKIAMDRTPYVGNVSKVSRLVGQLPAPDRFYMQNYIALQTNQQPYGLTAFYEPAATESMERPSQSDHEPNSKLANNSRKNALILFAMIDNVDEITFAFRGTPSTELLEESAYDIHLTYHRSDFAKQCNFNEISHNLEALGQAVGQLN